MFYTFGDILGMAAIVLITFVLQLYVNYKVLKRS